MYKEHRLFKTPPDNTKILRYMDFSKFVDILANSQLFFPTAANLGDPFEGSLTQAQIDYIIENIDKFIRSETWNLIPKEEFCENLSRIRRHKRKYVLQ